MGKRTAKRKLRDRDPEKTKAAKTLPSTFPCLFCNSDKSVMANLDKKAGVGDLSCNVCGQHFQTRINYLSVPVDVYSDWVDACDAVAKDAANASTDSPADKDGFTSLEGDDKGDDDEAEEVYYQY